MNIANAIPSTVSSVSFSLLSAEDVRRISVKQITNPVLLDELNRPNRGGLYDPALGPSEKQDICTTCRLTYFTCPGHYGHIELPSPVYHPLFMVDMFKLLRTACLFCHHFKAKRTLTYRFAAKLKLVEHGLLAEAEDMEDALAKRTNTSRRMEEQKEKGTDGMDVDEDEEETEGLDDLRPHIDAYVHHVLRQASTSSKNSYKESLVYQAKKALIQGFLIIASRKNCLNCTAHGYTFRKEGHVKVIEYDLPRNKKAYHDAIALKRPNVAALMAASSAQYDSRRTGKSIPAIPDQDESEEEEDFGDDTLSGEDVPMNDQAPVSQEHQVAKAANGAVKGKRGRNERVMPPEECRAHLRRLFANEQQMCSLIYGRHGPLASVSKNEVSAASADMFFLAVLPVSPTRFRPPAKMGDMLFEHPQNELLTRVINTSYRLKELTAELRAITAKSAKVEEGTARKLLGNLLERMIQLQIDVNSFIDSSKNPQPVRQGKLPPAGVKQGLEKKDGLFRMHMMGKRVNYAARSVISPDVNIEPNEIGIPPVFARKLTFPEPVTAANVHEMRQLVINGTKKYPGATMVEHENGDQVSLEKMSLEARTALANQLLKPPEGQRSAHTLYTRIPATNKKVYRHLKDGDVLILNRQPTLHKPSMMVHKAKVLQGEKTIRMHYANCNSYNADFDGDEMNIHFPQNQVARAEAMLIANTDNQYLVPTSGKPLRGLIQDHVVAGVWMTSQDMFFGREEYFQLLYGALRPEDEGGHFSGRLVTMPPTIWKPKPLWTGKQIISTVLLNTTPSNAHGLNLDARAKVPGQLWGHDSKEGEIIVMDGQLLSGVLDKAAFGATEFGLVHSVYELYGADVAGRLLGILSRLFTKFLQHRAFTCRMDDLTLTPEGDTCRKSLLDEGRHIGTEGAMENFPSLAETPAEKKLGALHTLLRDVLRDDDKMAGLDVTVKTKLSGLTKSIADACIPHRLSRRFPLNHMQTMTLSGAKGSAVNAQQISCALGQQELEGRRVPVMVSGKTLPSFKALETRAIAGGYVASRFLTGVKPQEFYFHCMAGREGLIDTAVKTSRSGYLQRCLIKHLEGLRVHYDYSVRGSDSSIYQFHYGGDALDVTKQKYLHQFDFTARNYLSLTNRYQPRNVQGLIEDRKALKYSRKVSKKSPENRGKYDPVMSMYNPATHLGATSERFADAVHRYTAIKPELLLRTGDEDQTSTFKRGPQLCPENTFRILANVQYLRALVDPGEAVGLLASQGVGEPSTQMTLNTFHFAGHGAANVTLGIPRLREIVMTASSKPKTPSMIIPLRTGLPAGAVDRFCKRANRLALSQLVENVTVTERHVSHGPNRSKEYAVHVNFYPRAEYEEQHDIEPASILATFGTRFPTILKKEIIAEMKKLNAVLRSEMTEIGKGKASRDAAKSVQADEDGDNADVEGSQRSADENSEIGDGGADAAKRQRQRQELESYEEDEEDREGDELEATSMEAAPTKTPHDGEDMVDEDNTSPVQAVTKASDQLKELTGGVTSLFLQNLKQAASFAFTDARCQFKLEFPQSIPKLLLVDIVERACLKTVVREIPGISQCFKGKSAQGGHSEHLVTNGSNFKGLWDYAFLPEQPVMDENAMYSNDIYGFLTTYGVEAARTAIIKEISGVFNAYKIDVDGRHLELIADYMTFDGWYKPFNRKGIATHSSPLLKASYETTASFLSDAALYGDFDTLTSPSGNIVLGKPGGTGTGAFDVVMPIDVPQ